MFCLCLEASHQKGMGHAVRMLHVANGLRERGLAVLIAMNDYAPVKGLFTGAGHQIEIVDFGAPASWQVPLIERHAITHWVDDRLETDATHAQAVQQAGCQLITFDNAGEGANEVDLHLCALAVVPAERRVGKRVLEGLDYFILSPEIEQYRKARTQLSRILVSMGGTDTYGVTLNVLDFLRDVDLPITVIKGPGFIHDIPQAALAPNIQIKTNVPSLIAEMAEHDIAITGGGITPFEANACGLPCLIIASEWFEVDNAELLASKGGSIFLGHHRAVNALVLPHDISAMSESAMHAVSLDGMNNVINAITAL